MARKKSKKLLYPRVLGAVLRDLCGAQELRSLAKRAGVLPSTMTRILRGQVVTDMQKVGPKTSESWWEAVLQTLGEPGFAGLLSFAAARCRSQEALTIRG